MATTLNWLSVSFDINFFFDFFFFFFNEIRGAASNSTYYGYPELWILRYPTHRYHAGIRTHDPLVESPMS
jgi:hypothetical protein